MITTTLNRIREHGPCEDGWRKLLAGLGKTAPDDEPLPYAKIVEINGIDDALWACRAEPQYAKEWRLFAVWCARQVEHLMTDDRSRAALDVAERYANGLATDGELDAAKDAARDAAMEAASSAAMEAASAAAWAAARAAASSAARAAASAAAWAAASSAARAAAWAAARGAAWGDARGAQTTKFIEIVGGEND
ncbi:hypothetical protein LG047_15575 [Methylocystis sp. WRRC1]|uniref:hypothetical protein n=1 Tax=Methylocystis sp. WRRC1 TaxID=1732014 RepID=UPI001D154AD5|nr:hypothetical protein [Methylocystis sp. WRRC1]MCC3246720.1 hypothetical protein [Methylocystis sp. WRRC1]